VSPRASLDRCGKSGPPLGFDPQTVQPVASRYMDYATLPSSTSRGWVIKLKCYFTLFMCHAMLRFNTLAQKHIRNTDFLVSVKIFLSKM
jgi:hypothetical protein